ncbi:hypothetical protein [Streptomyces pseudovenezuelae]|uniref:hypothetical protein n=1 Tax=Streptomyces pseudovenezuelae TaxID=67350 RepID=UPI0039A7736A
MPSGMGSQHPSPGTAGAKRLSGHGGHRHDLRVGAGGGRGVGHTEVVRRRPRPAARPGRPTGPSREGRSWTTRVTRPVGHAVGGRTARGGAAVPAPSRDTAAAGGADTGTDRPGAVGVPAVLAHHASPRLATPEVRSTRHAALFDAAEGVNHLAVVGGHSLGMSQYAVGGFTKISATLATRIDRITMEETGEPIEVTSPDQIALAGLLESGAADRGAQADGPAGPGLAGRLPGGTPPAPDPRVGRRLPRPAAHRPRRTPPAAGHPLPCQPCRPGVHGPGPRGPHGRRLRLGLHDRRPGAPAAGRGQVVCAERQSSAAGPSGPRPASPA